MNNLTEAEKLSIKEVYNNLYKGKFDVLNRLFNQEDFKKFKTKTLLKMAIENLQIEINERNFYRWVNIQKSKYTNTPIHKEKTPIKETDKQIDDWNIVDPQEIKTEKAETIKKVKTI